MCRKYGILAILLGTAGLFLSASGPAETRDLAAVVKKAVRSEAEKLGILVVSCDPNDLKYGILACRSGEDPDDVGSYRRAIYASAEDVLLVPGAERTLASFQGDEVYMLDRDGGMSWGAPYIAGLAALAFQVNPRIAPQRIIELLVATARRTEAGPIVNPAGFIEAVEKDKDGNRPRPGSR